MSHPTGELEQTCPYDKSHIILASRMHTHLHRCSKNYPSWFICQHNTTHRFPTVTELEHHQEHLCENRHSFQSGQYELQNAESVPAPTFSIEHIEPEPLADNWEDGQTNHFDPNKNAEEKSTIRGVSCVPRSERITFKNANRRRLQDQNSE